MIVVSFLWAIRVTLSCVLPPLFFAMQLSEKREKEYKEKGLIPVAAI